MTTRRHFIKQTGLTTLGLGLIPSFSKAFGGQWDSGSDSFSRTSPESQGVSSAAIRQFISAANASGLNWHSFMLLRHGNVIAEGWWKPFESQDKHTLYSLSKSFTSTAVGILVKEGKLKVDDPVISFFPDELPAEVSDNLKAMTVKHLLTMNTGHGFDTTPNLRVSTTTWTKTFLSLPVPHAPGSHFLYNSGGTYMLGAIIHKLTGQDLETYLRPRLFGPLDIKDLDWEKSPDGLNVAGWGLRLKTEDIAKLGQLYLQKGKWNGKEILSEQWVTDAGSALTSSNPGDSDWSQGYGYQFWRCKPGFFRGDGAFGQYCIVMPQHDAVLAINSESWDMQKQMTIIWETLLPAMQASALPENENERLQLKTDIAGLALPVTKGSLTSSLSKKYRASKWKFNANDFGISAMELSLADKACNLMIQNEKGKVSIDAAWEKWNTGKESIVYPAPGANSKPVPSKIASSATWINDQTLQIDLRFVENIHGDKLTFVFNENQVTVSFLNSVSESNPSNPDRRPKLEGTLG